jgi:hypothetical protein
MAKIRVYEIAAVCEIETKQMLNILDSLGVMVRGAASTVSDEVATEVMKQFGKNPEMPLSQPIMNRCHEQIVKFSVIPSSEIASEVEAVFGLEGANAFRRAQAFGESGATKAWKDSPRQKNARQSRRPTYQQRLDRDWANEWFTPKEREAWINVGLAPEDHKLAAAYRHQGLQPADVKETINGTSFWDWIDSGKSIKSFVQALSEKRKNKTA